MSKGSITVVTSTVTIRMVLVLPLHHSSAFYWLIYSQWHSIQPTENWRYRKSLSLSTFTISWRLFLPDRNILRGCAEGRRGDTPFSLAFPVRFNCILIPQNFLALCASNYFDGCIFHRNIRGFMIQTGDPSGVGKGGQSIWGKPFPDEIRSTLKVSPLYWLRFMIWLLHAQVQCARRRRNG